jgi:predicted amidohydrolase
MNDSMRVAAVQFDQRAVGSREDFLARCAFFVDTAAGHGADVVLFPELFSNPLMALPGTGPVGVRRLHQHTPALLEAFTALATSREIDIIAGSHLMLDGDRVVNVAHLVRRDGSIAHQRKLHITPGERQAWQVEPGQRVEVFETSRGRIAILICYDIEFPELARIATAKGADVIFVPFNTDLRSGYLRVRTCAAARCIENNVYCVLAGAVGALAGVPGSDLHYARSCILTPSDLPFARDGIAAEAESGNETMVVHDLDLALVRRTRAGGTVRPWADRRSDLYRLSYLGEGEAREV